MRSVLLDTGCIVALLDRQERYHKPCREIVAGLPDPLVTCEAVIGEACFLLRGVPGAREAILTNVQEGAFRISFRLEDKASSIRRLMEKYKRLPMSLADACLVTMADDMATGRILTLDSDFSIYRWGRHRSFELLVPL